MIVHLWGFLLLHVARTGCWRNRQIRNVNESRRKEAERKASSLYSKDHEMRAATQDRKLLEDSLLVQPNNMGKPVAFTPSSPERLSGTFKHPNIRSHLALMRPPASSHRGDVRERCMGSCDFEHHLLVTVPTLQRQWRQHGEPMIPPPSRNNEVRHSFSARMGPREAPVHRPLMVTSSIT